VKRQWLCSNKNCSPLFPFVGIPLERIQGEDRVYNKDGTLYETTMYCGICKGHYVYEGKEGLPTVCPKCKVATKWATAKRWSMVCPKCGV